MTTAGEIIKIKTETRLSCCAEIANRFSPRYFSDEKVKSRDIDSIFEAAVLLHPDGIFNRGIFIGQKKKINLIIKLFPV